MLPGGGLKEGETEEVCIKCEIKEETNLEVKIDRILFDEPSTGADVYKRYITFLCTSLAGRTIRILDTLTVAIPK